MPLIYIVEDDVNIREIERYALKNSGFEVADFECGRDIKGEVMLNQIPKNPMMSKFVLSNSKVYWLLHENGEL